MGDFRASVKIEAEMFGVKRKSDMWINWSTESSECPGVDQRVIDFFREFDRAAHDEYERKFLDRKAKEKASEEAQERAEFARLKAKYESLE